MQILQKRAKKLKKIQKNKATKPVERSCTDS